LLNDADCQKKFICEAFRHRRQLGQLGLRGRHAVNTLAMLADYSPDPILNVLDEFEEGKERGERVDDQDCGLIFWQCPNSLLPFKQRYDQLSKR
jgi:hypothetical protein